VTADGMRNPFGWFDDGTFRFSMAAAVGVEG
jgi:hypothetical protein